MEDKRSRRKIITGKIDEIKPIFSTYNEVRPEIEKKLKQFAKKGARLSRKDILKEICFCILTPQSKAETCWKCIEKLNNSEILAKGTKNQIQRYLKGIRFYRTKSESIIRVRDMLEEIIDILKKEKKPTIIRQYLVKNVRGLGMKEATHFLRNIGKSDNLVILDRHILRKLHKLKIIKNIPESISVKEYLKIEKKAQKFADNIGMPVSHLDFVFWYQETGRIFK